MKLTIPRGYNIKVLYLKYSSKTGMVIDREIDREEEIRPCKIEYTGEFFRDEKRGLFHDWKVPNPDCIEIVRMKLLDIGMGYSCNSTEMHAMFEHFNGPMTNNIPGQRREIYDYKTGKVIHDDI